MEKDFKQTIDEVSDLSSQDELLALKYDVCIDSNSNDKTK